MQKQCHCGHDDLRMQARRGLYKVIHFTLTFRPTGIAGNNQHGLGYARLFLSIYIVLESQLDTVVLWRGILLKYLLLPAFLKPNTYILLSEPHEDFPYINEQITAKMAPAPDGSWTGTPPAPWCPERSTRTRGLILKQRESACRLGELVCLWTAKSQCFVRSHFFFKLFFQALRLAKPLFR